MVNPRQPKHIKMSCEKSKCQGTIKGYQGGMGAILYYERYETIIPISSLDYAPKYKLACEACQKYGKNFACPPYSPHLSEYLEAQRYVKVLCIRMPQEHVREESQEKAYRKCFRKARSILVEELLSYRKQGYLIAGSGFCQACDVCVVEEGVDFCKKPDKRIYSLESLGVNLIALTKRVFGFDLEWSTNDHEPGFICALGAIFMNKSKAGG